MIRRPTATTTQVLQETMSKSNEQLKEAARLKKEDDERIQALEEEVNRVAARCRELVKGGEEASEVTKYVGR